MTKASDIVDRASQLLNDRGEVWPRSELLDYLNAALGKLVDKVPDQFVTDEEVVQVAGVQQTLPAGGVAFMRPLHNVDGQGNAGRAPRLVSRDLLDRSSPNWQSATPGEARQVAHDPRYPRTWWVSPPQTGGEKMRIEFVKRADLIDFDDLIPVDARYESALVNYVLYRALSKDEDYAAQDGRAALHFAAFQDDVGNGPDTGSN